MNNIQHWRFATDKTEYALCEGLNVYGYMSDFKSTESGGFTYMIGGLKIQNVPFQYIEPITEEVDLNNLNWFYKEQYHIDLPSNRWDYDPESTNRPTKVYFYIKTTNLK